MSMPLPIKEMSLKNWLIKIRRKIRIKLKPQKTQEKEERMILEMNQKLEKQFKILEVAVYLYLFPSAKEK
jgi:hypothetical protein